MKTTILFRVEGLGLGGLSKYDNCRDNWDNFLTYRGYKYTY